MKSKLNLELNSFGSRIKLSGFIFFRRIAYIIFGTLDMIFDKEKKDVIVFCYHSVARDLWRFSINFETIKKQIEYLLKKRKPISMDELLRHIKGERIIMEPSFLLTFDDGYRDLLETKDFFYKHGIKPLTCVLADLNNANIKVLGTNRPLLLPGEIIELKNAGWDIGCHSATHPDLTQLDDNLLQNEVVESKANLQKILGFPVSCFAYPKGNYSLKIVNAVKKADYKIAFSMNGGFVRPFSNQFAVPRVGVDRTHSFREFTFLDSPLVIKLRLFLQAIGIKG